MSSTLMFGGAGDSSSSADNNLRGSSSDDAASADNDFFDNPWIEAFMCYGWLLLLFYCALCKRSQGSPSTAMGDAIRQRAREYNERLERQEEKKTQSPEERKILVVNSLQTKRVLAKDSEGNWTLGDVVEDAENKAEAIETASLEDIDIDDDDEDETCVICLDSFMQDDSVSWSKHSKTCNHVFHTDCIVPWLQDRKQDECPSCRSVLVCYPCIDEKKDPEKDVEDTENEEKETTDEESHVSTKDESLFVIMHGLITRAIIPRMTRPPSVYDLVSANSNSFDSSDQQSQPQTQQQQQDDYNLVSVSSSFDSNDESEHQNHQTRSREQSSESQSEGTEVERQKQRQPLSTSESTLRRVPSDISDSSFDLGDGEPLEMSSAVTDLSKLKITQVYGEHDTLDDEQDNGGIEV